MALSIYSTLARQVVPFTPLVAGKVGMYVCGVTVYDYCHIGHARTFVAFDVIRRWLEIWKTSGALRPLMSPEPRNLFRRC